MKLSISILLFFVWSSSADAGQFVGHLRFYPAGCERTRDCRLVSNFGYIDSHGLGWQSSANDTTDGATIPDWAQDFIGTPFESDFIRAAVIHDHYCDRHVRTWRETHWVFYDALRTSGVNSLKAKIMYFAVLIGGPKWIELIPGEKCNVGQLCIKQVGGGTTIPASHIVQGQNGEKIAVRSATYDRPEFLTELKEGQKAIEAAGDAMSLDMIYAMALAKQPEDFFFKNGDAIVFERDANDLPTK